MPRFKIGYWKDNPIEDEPIPFVEYIIDAIDEKAAWLEGNTRFQRAYPAEDMKQYTSNSEKVD